MKNKYLMPLKQNLKYVSDNMDLLLYNCMRLARYDVDEQFCANLKISNPLSTEEEIAYRNFENAFSYIVRTIDYETNYHYLLDLHTILMQGLMEDRRNDLTDDQVAELLNIINKPAKANTEIAIDVMLYILDKKLFIDGDVRVALMFANKIMIQNGCGVITVNPKDDDVFREYLRKGESDLENFKDWVFKYGIKGVKNDY